MESWFVAKKKQKNKKTKNFCCSSSSEVVHMIDSTMYHTVRAGISSTPNRVLNRLPL